MFFVFATSPAKCPFGGQSCEPMRMGSSHLDPYSQPGPSEKRFDNGGLGGTLGTGVFGGPLTRSRTWRHDYTDPTSLPPLTRSHTHTGPPQVPVRTRTDTHTHGEGTSAATIEGGRGSGGRLVTDRCTLTGLCRLEVHQNSPLERDLDPQSGIEYWSTIYCAVRSGRKATGWRDRGRATGRGHRRVPLRTRTVTTSDIV